MENKSENNLSMIINTVISTLMLLMFIATWQVIELKGNTVDTGNLYLYLTVLIGSILTEKLAYTGPRKPGAKSHLLLRYVILLFWWMMLLASLIEHYFYPRMNAVITITAAVIVITGTVIRAVSLEPWIDFFLLI